jgi:formate hydrogenlyase subunit 3/multisubunit Na+/H+ antiporter MnhD subunit
LVIKIMSFSFSFILILFFLFILNIGFPPFIGFLSEILILKAVMVNIRIIWIIILGVLFRCYYNIYLFWCFNGIRGVVFKISFYRIDIFIFLLLSLVLNF